MRFYSIVLIFVFLAFMSDLRAGVATLPYTSEQSNPETSNVNMLKTNGTVYHLGLLVQQHDGTVDMIIGTPLIGHKRLLEGYNKAFGNVSKILWAGELEEINGAVTRINETAGIIKEDMEGGLTEGLDVPGTGINNLKTFLSTLNVVMAKYFMNTEYITYNKDDEHLNEYLTDVSYLRHDLNGDLNRIAGFYSLINDVDCEPNDLALYLSIFSSNAKNLLNHYNRAINLMPEFNTSEWHHFETYIIALANSPINEPTKYNFSEAEFTESLNLLLNRQEKLFRNDAYRETTIVNRLNLDNGKHESFQKMKDKLQKNIELDKSIINLVQETPELFNDDNIIHLLKDAAKASTKIEERVLFEQAESLIQAKKKSFLTTGEELETKYQLVKKYLQSGEKDNEIFYNRLKTNSNVQYDHTGTLTENFVEVLVENLIKKKGMLDDTETTKLFFGTEARNFQDSLYNQVQKYNNDGLNDKFFFLSLIILANNNSVKPNGHDVDIKTQMVDFIKQHDGFFDKLNAFDSRKEVDRNFSIERWKLLPKLQLIEERLKLENIKI